MNNDHLGQVTVLKNTSTKPPKVSILCTTFNHERYIEKTMEGFLNQKTDFSYEIIVHDDASTDRTVDILKEFHQKFPEKVKLVLQTENQFSKRHFKPMLFTAQYASGDVYMLCEGDDYWVSDNKIQYQYEKYLEYDNVDLVFHSTFREFPDGRRDVCSRHSEEEWLFSASRVILGTGGFCPTASILISSNVFSIMPNELISNMPCSDAFFQIYGSLRGGALYLPCCYSVWSIESDSSVTEKLKSSSSEKRKQFNLKMAGCYKLIRKKTHIKYAMALRKMEKKYLKKSKR